MVDDGNCVGANELAAGDLYGAKQVRFAPKGQVDQVGNGFRVGVGGKNIALGGELLAQAFVIFDDAVVNDGNAAGNVRVGVTLGRNAVRCPAGVGDASPGIRTGRGFFQFHDPSDGAHPLDMIGLNDSQTG